MTTVRPLFVFCGVVVALLAAVGQAAASPFTVTMQPIQICDDAGVVCGNQTRTLFEDYANAIWEQAGIDVVFRPWASIHETDYLEADMLFPGSSIIAPEAQQMMTLALGINDPAATLAINIFFSPQLGDGYYGMGCGGPFYAVFCHNQVGIFISDDIFADPLRGGKPRPDTISHEIGHVLNLQHSSAFNQLMTNGRTIVETLADVAPDGKGLDLLTLAEIQTALGSQWLTITAEPDPLTPVPEPATLTLLVGGLAATQSVRRRRSRHAGTSGRPE